MLRLRQSRQAGSSGPHRRSARPTAGRSPHRAVSRGDGGSARSVQPLARVASLPRPPCPGRSAGSTPSAAHCADRREEERRAWPGVRRDQHRKNHAALSVKDAVSPEAASRPWRPGTAARTRHGDRCRRPMRRDIHPSQTVPMRPVTTLQTAKAEASVMGRGGTSGSALRPTAASRPSPSRVRRGGSRPQHRPVPILRDGLGPAVTRPSAALPRAAGAPCRRPKPERRTGSGFPKRKPPAALCKTRDYSKCGKDRPPSMLRIRSGHAFPAEGPRWRTC